MKHNQLVLHTWKDATARQVPIALQLIAQLTICASLLATSNNLLALHILKIATVRQQVIV